MRILIRMLLWLSIRQTLRSKMSILRPVLIVEVGSLQVFGYQSKEQIDAKAPIETVYWQDVRARVVHGPFPNITEAMTHYAWSSEQQKASDKGLGQVIYVNFRDKKRVVYGPV